MRSSPAVCERCPDDSWVLPAVGLVGLVYVCRALLRALPKGSRVAALSSLVTHMQVVVLLVVVVQDFEMIPGYVRMAAIAMLVDYCCGDC